MSCTLSAAPAKSADPRLFGSFEGSVIWPGRGTEGIVRCVLESLGTLVPSTAISVREPPWGLGSSDDIVKLG